MEAKRGNPDIVELGKETQFQSGSQAAEMGRLGGIKSGESKRAKRTAREAAQRLLAMPANGKRLDGLKDLGYDPGDVEGMANIDALVGRLFAMALAGNLQAAERLTKIAGYDCEEERAERESLNADRRKNRESEARLIALEAGTLGRQSTSITDSDEGDSVEDVFIYLPDNGRDPDFQKTAPMEKREVETAGAEDTEEVATEQSDD